MHQHVKIMFVHKTQNVPKEGCVVVRKDISPSRSPEIVSQVSDHISSAISYNLLLNFITNFSNAVTVSIFLGLYGDV